MGGFASSPARERNHSVSSRFRSRTRTRTQTIQVAQHPPQYHHKLGGGFYFDENVEDTDSVNNCVEIVYSTNTAVNSLESPLSKFNLDDGVLLTGGMLGKNFDFEDVFQNFHSWIRCDDLKITCEHLGVVKSSWRSILTGTDSFLLQQKYFSPASFFTGVLYQKLFENIPNSFALFSQNKLETVGNGVVQMISRSLELFLNPQNLMKSLYLLGDRHVVYGVRHASSFAIFGECLIRAVATCSGFSWNLECEEAWIEIISAVVIAMSSRVVSKGVAPASY